MQSGSFNGKIKVLVVDDSAFVRRSIIRMYQESEEIEIVDAAANGEEAVALTMQLRPDVVTLDVQMPVLDGFSALERIMRECPTPVIMLSSLTAKGAEETLKALELGAVDFIDKNCTGGFMHFSSIATELTSKIHTAARVDVAKLVRSPAREAHPEPKQGHGEGSCDVVAIGTSTGGPPALQRILAQLPSNFCCPILIVQHMPEGFTASLAERLNRHSPLVVKEASDGEWVVAGTAYIAPAGWHMRLRRQAGKLQLWLDAAADGSLHRPSVDALFHSVAEVCGARSLAVVLTGMGKDGSAGARAVKAAGGRVVVEAEESAVVYGMPKAVVQSVQVDAEVPLPEVAATIAEVARS